MANRKWYQKKRFIIPICAILFFKGCTLLVNNIEVPQSASRNNSVIKQSGKVISSADNVLFNSKGEEVKPDLIYSIESEEIYDAPLKTQITQHIFISKGSYTEDDVKYILNVNFESAVSRMGFEYHNPATHYQIIVYPDKERAVQKSSNWVGILNKIGKSSSIQYDFSESIIAAQYAQDSVISNLTEDRRKKVWEESILAERKAGTNGELLEQLERAVCDKYNINDDQRVNILVEAIQKGWLKPE